MEKTFKYTCLDCGKEFEWPRYKLPRRRLCSDCAYKRVTDNARQLMDHKGPSYEKWKKGLKKAARRL